jgi:hypothetical protein
VYLRSYIFMAATRSLEEINALLLKIAEGIIDDFWNSLRAKCNVLRFQISMCDAVPMQVLQPV